eukprot:COSAG06_NODE_354_length_16880_cov_7.746545_8_plen_97_part_00
MVVAAARTIRSGTAAAPGRHASSRGRRALGVQGAGRNRQACGRGQQRGKGRGGATAGVTLDSIRVGLGLGGRTDLVPLAFLFGRSHALPVLCRCSA